MYCSHCNWDFPTDPDFELSGGGTCPGCGSKYGASDDGGHHETGSDGGEGDILLDEMDDEKDFDW